MSGQERFLQAKKAILYILTAKITQNTSCTNRRGKDSLVVFSPRITRSDNITQPCLVFVLVFQWSALLFTFSSHRTIITNVKIVLMRNAFLLCECFYHMLLRQV